MMCVCVFLVSPHDMCAQRPGAAASGSGAFGAAAAAQHATPAERREGGGGEGKRTERQAPGAAVPRA